MPPNANDNANLILYEHRNKKLPLAILIHHNFFFSLIYAVLVGVSSFKKWRDFNSTDSLNSSLLLPVYWTWVVVEASRLYSGQKGVLLEKVPELTAFFLRFVHGILTRIDPSLGPVDERDHDGSTIYGRWFDAETAAFNVNE
mmetsp:Transcript_16187/g.27349  ORF Transcript_16187/g.27349 Transcript_16187/m.27349 type:complete len:142 (+) Transcript_16187:162-587(+)